VSLAKRFGSNLAHQRRLADISQEELSVRASVHRTEISQLERGLRVARIDTLVKLAGSLGIDPCLLLEGLSWQRGATRLGNFDIAPPSQGSP
jgi:transcriptional regulator with XRE-family HTH domain